MAHFAQSCRSPFMPTPESASVATANLTPPMAATRSAALENQSWAAPLPRTYFVGGYRVEHQRNSLGGSTWSCDCAEFARARAAGSECGCQHTQRIAEAAELDRLLRTPGLIVPPGCY
jgi:hypothetical protein